MSRTRADRSTQVVAAAPWIVVLLGVGVMIILLVLAFVAMRGDRRPFDGLAVSAPPTGVLPEPPVETTAGSGPRPRPSRTSAAPRPTTSPSRPLAPTASATRPQAASPSASPRSPQPSLLVAPAVAGRYRVVQSYRDSFIGEVRVVNVSTAGQDWAVRLTFPAEVDRLRTFWVESGPQATANRSGSAYLFTGSMPIPPGQAVTLRMHFHRAGAGDRPTGCTVNGLACVVS